MKIFECDGTLLKLVFERPQAWRSWFLLRNFAQAKQPAATDTSLMVAMSDGVKQRRKAGELRSMGVRSREPLAQQGQRRCSLGVRGSEGFA